MEVMKFTVSSQTAMNMVEAQDEFVHMSGVTQED